MREREGEREDKGRGREGGREEECQIMNPVQLMMIH